jgi:hypothetical protein
MLFINQISPKKEVLQTAISSWFLVLCSFLDVSQYLGENSKKFINCKQRKLFCASVNLTLSYLKAAIFIVITTAETSKLLMQMLLSFL